MPLSGVTAINFEQVFIWLESIFGNRLFEEGIYRETELNKNEM